MTFAAPFQRPGVKPSYVGRDGLVFWEGSMIVDVHIHSWRYPDHFIKEIFLLSTLQTTKDPNFMPPVLMQKTIAVEWLGRKTGKGFYEYKKKF